MVKPARDSEDMWNKKANILLNIDVHPHISNDALGKGNLIYLVSQQLWLHMLLLLFMILIYSMFFFS